ncbi:MAG: hypothetical protein HQK96_10890 [Nitrospirae bacterium]|nr:hypothetical protein [Nitrospirota bacterium]
MIKLGDLEFQRKLLWPNRHEWTGISAAVERTLSGGVVVYDNEISGRPIDIEGSETTGWITYADLKTLRAMAMVLDAVYVLIYEDETFDVRFRHEDAPVLDFKPLLERSSYSDNDYFYGTIKLMEV